MRNVLLLKIYKSSSSLHINPSFQFLSSIKPKSAACVHSFPPTRTVHTYGGGEEENCQQPILYTYVTWHLFAYLCLALSLSCWPKNSPGQLSNPPVTPPKILWGGVCCHLGCTYSGQPGHILSQPVLSSPHT